MTKRRKPARVSPQNAGRRIILGYTRLADAKHRLRAKDYAYDSYGEFLREHGEWDRPTKVIRFSPRLCFANAITFATCYGWTYVEGLAVPRLSGGQARPFGHAWCIDEHGTRIELTWPFVGAAYLGVPFHVGRADDATWNGDACVLDDAERGHPLLREPWAGEDFTRDWPDKDRLRQLRVMALTEQGRQGFIEAGAPDPWPYLLKQPSLEVVTRKSRTDAGPTVEITAPDDATPSEAGYSIGFNA